MSGYAADAVVDGFERSRVLFESLVERLAGADAMRVTHDELEKQVEQALLRRPPSARGRPEATSGDHL